MKYRCGASERILEVSVRALECPATGQDERRAATDSLIADVQLWPNRPTAFKWCGAIVGRWGARLALDVPSAARSATGLEIDCGIDS